MTELDTRINACRPDLADRRLQGQVQAARFVDGVPARIASASVLVRGRPDAAASATTELLFGEDVLVFERKDGWAWVQNAADGYVGYLPEAALASAGPPPTHRVATLSAPLRPDASIKATPTAFLSLHSGVVVTGFSPDGKWARIDTGGWLPAPLLAAADVRESDPVAVAQRLLGAPYVWGGRTSAGLDCSALVQLALARCGIAAPRDSDQQRASLGTQLPAGATLQKGDIVFFPGHVGFMLDGSRVLHANATNSRVSIDPLADVIAWTASGGGLLQARRIQPSGATPKNGLTLQGMKF